LQTGLEAKLLLDGSEDGRSKIIGVCHSNVGHPFQFDIENTGKADPGP
jgi:hypothetical protein